MLGTRHCQLPISLASFAFSFFSFSDGSLAFLTLLLSFIIRTQLSVGLGEWFFPRSLQTATEKGKALNRTQGWREEFNGMFVAFASANRADRPGRYYPATREKDTDEFLALFDVTSETLLCYSTHNFIYLILEFATS